MDAHGVETLGHGGNSAGCSSYLLFSPEAGIGAVVMTNQSEEEVYNYAMMDLVFGAFEEKNYFDGPRQNPEGIYRSARIVRKGPLKLSSLSFVGGEWDLGECWDRVDTGKYEKVCYTITDYLRLPVAEFVLELGLIALWGAAAVFSILTLLVRLIRFIIIGKTRRKETGYRPDRWGVAAGVSQLAVLALVAAFAVSATAYAVGSSYAWMFGLLGILAVWMVLLTITGIYKTFRRPCGRFQKVMNVTTAFFLIVSVANICYWNLFMFWAL